MLLELGQPHSGLLKFLLQVKAVRGMPVILAMLVIPALVAGQVTVAVLLLIVGNFVLVILKIFMVYTALGPAVLAEKAPMVMAAKGSVVVLETLELLVILEALPPR